jgi:hypothetical protein
MYVKTTAGTAKISSGRWVVEDGENANEAAAVCKCRNEAAQHWQFTLDRRKNPDLKALEAVATPARPGAEASDRGERQMHMTTAAQRGSSDWC